MAQLLLQNRSSGESTSPNLLPSWTFILWNPASSFGRARGDWSLRHHFWEPAGEIHKDTLGNHLVSAPCHGQNQLSLPQPMTPTWRITPLNIVLRWRGRITFTVDHRHEASGLQKSNAYHQSHHKNYFTRHFLWPSAARPLPCPNSGELLADITPLAPHAVFGVSWPMTYNSMGPGRGGSSSLNTDLPSSSVFWGAATRKLWQREWARDIMAHNRANTGLGCCILVRKSLEALFRIEGFSLWRPSEAGTARSLGTEVAVHCLCKGQQRRDRCLSRRDEYYFAKNREDLLSILQDLNQPALPSSPLKLSPLRAMEAGLTLPLFPLSVLPPLSFLRKAGYE